MILTVSLLLAASLEFHGTIGQYFTPESGAFIPWTSCSWVAADGNGDVHFPDGFVCRRGTRCVVPESCSLPAGRVISDGAGRIFVVRADNGTVAEVKVSEAGLSVGRTIAVMGGPTRKVAAGRQRFLSLDTREKKVFGWTRDGKELGTVLDLREMKAPSCVAEHPGSGDILVATYWPENKIHRFRGDGTEVRDSCWPAVGAPEIANVGDDTWAYAGGAVRVGRGTTERAQAKFGLDAYPVRGIAASSDGLWLATGQGAQFYPASDPGRCALRVGGISATALAACNGHVYVAAGSKLFDFLLDDGPGDRIRSDESWKWNLSERFPGANITAVMKGEGVLYLKDSSLNRVIAFNPGEETYSRRDRRFFAVADMEVKGESEKMRSREGEWVVAYDAERHAINRYRVRKGGDR